MAIYPGQDPTSQAKGLKAALLIQEGQVLLDYLISFYDKVIHFMDERKAVNVYLEFNKALDTISHSIFLEILSAHDIDGWTLAGWQGLKSGSERN